MRHQQIFVNLPIKDLERTRRFYSALGYAFNPQFSNDQAVAMIISDDIYAMLLVEPFFQTFTPKAIADAHQTTEVLTCLSCESRAQVDDLIAKAKAAGGTIPREPQDMGFMYSQAYADPDGHIWELMHMDLSQFPGA
ncbi:VOC family protein [Roseateles amylovorans]|uniref:VOC family protein n=1 Tax=Roseateles amylovorans TaxID=2978473 RepID=A0ABY6B3B4_9BURK|nr:VOC family protein [Roseateles amylovorans]UXH78018.1 VOC family protein [Roseateles amylovorans]